jgi:hypothetical protein
MPPGIFIGNSVIKIQTPVIEEEGMRIIDDEGNLLIDDEGKFIVE